MENTHTFTKSNTPPWVFSLFKSCINATKARNASHMIVISFYRLCFQYCSEGPERLLNVLYTFSLNPDSRGEFIREVAVRGCLKKIVRKILQSFHDNMSIFNKASNYIKKHCHHATVSGNCGNLFCMALFQKTSERLLIS